MSKTQFFFFLAVLVAILPLVIVISRPGNQAHLIACNVGEGDAILITEGTTQILIDGGPNNQVLDCLTQNMPFYDKTIELMVNTHPEKDHLTGLISVLDRYEVRELLANSVATDSDVFRVFYQKVIEKKIPVFSPQKGDIIKVNDLELDVLWPEKTIFSVNLWDASMDNKHTAVCRLSSLSPNREPSSISASCKAELGMAVLGENTVKIGLNKYSLVFHFKKDNFDAILAGDIDQNIEKQIIADQKFQGIEVLKIPHHGSKYSSSEEFLKVVNPQIAIISVGKNSYGHPTPEVLDRLGQLNIKILRTDKDKINIGI